MLFLGFALIAWLTRNTEPSDARQAICLSFSISLAALALLGLFELLKGSAGLGIVIAVATELVLAFLYFKLWLAQEGKARELS